MSIKSLLTYNTRVPSRALVPFLSMFLGCFAVVIYMVVGLVPVQAATKTWDGGGTGNNWSTCANWSGDTCPLTTDIATFDGTSTKDVTIDASALATIATLNINSGYTGTVTLGRSFTVTGNLSLGIGTSGKFDGTNQTLAVNGSLNVTGGKFTSTSATLTVNGIYVDYGATFDGTTGTVNFTGTGINTICNANTTFNLVTFNKSTAGVTFTGCNLPLGNNPTVNIVSSSSYTWTLSNTTLSGTGTITIANNGKVAFNAGSTLSGFTGFVGYGITASASTIDFTGYTTFNFSSTGIGLTETASANVTLPNIAVALPSISITGSTFKSTSGTLTITGTFYLSGTTPFDANGGTVAFTGTGNQAYTCNNVAFANVTITRTSGNVTGTNCNFPLGNNPTINLGNSGYSIGLTGGTVSGTGTLTMFTNNGIGFTGVTLSGFTGFVGYGVSLINGTYDFSSYSPFSYNGAALTITTSAVVTFPNLTISVSDLTLTNSSLKTTSGTLNIAGNLSITGSGSLDANGGTVNFNGGSSVSYACNGVTFANIIINRTTGGSVTSATNCNFPLGNNPTINLGPAGYSIGFTGGSLSGTGTLTMSNLNGIGVNGTTVSGFSGFVGYGVSLINGTYDFGSYSPFSFNSADLTITTSANVTFPNLSISVGVLTLTNSTLKSTSGILNIAGGLSITGTSTFNANSGTVNFNGGGSVTYACNSVTFANVTINRTTGGSITSATNCNFPLGNNPTVYLGNSGYYLGLTSSTLSGTGNLSLGSLNGLTLNSGAALSGFSGLSANALTVAGATADLSSFSAVTLTGALSVSSGTLSLPPTASASSLTLSSTGVLNAPSGTFSVGGALSISGSSVFNANGGTVNFGGASSTVLSCNNAVFSKVILSGSSSQTVNANCNLPLGNNPTVTSYVNLNGTLTGTGTLTSTNANFLLNPGGSLSGFNGLVTNVLTLNDNGANLNLSSYSTVTVNGTLTVGASDTLTLPSGAVINGDLTLLSTGSTLGTTTGDITVTGSIGGGAGTIFNAPTGTLNVGKGFTATGTFNHNSGIISLNTSVSSAMACAVSTVFNKVIINNSALLTIPANCTVPLGDSPTIGNSVTLTGKLTGTGALTMNTGTLTLNVGQSITGFSSLSLPTLSVSSSVGTVNWSALSSLAINGTLTVQSNSGLTLPPNTTITGLATQTGSSAAITGTTGDVNLAGGLTITSGTFTAPTGNLYIGGNFTHSSGSTFTANGGTVIFNGGSQIISGIATTFNNFTKIIPTASAATLTFPASVTTTITGNLVLNGYDDTARLLLRSSSTGTRWNIDAQGTRSLLYLDVKDSNNINAASMQMGGTGSIDSTNNIAWNFGSLTPNAPTNLGPSNVISGITALTLKPAFTFTLSDPNTLDTVKYQIQVDDNSDFSSPLIDYTSALLSQTGTKTFTTGQAVGTGTYTVGAAGQSLTTGSYYWRVKATDNNGLISSYATANSGSIAFYIDSTTPNSFTPTLNVSSPTPNARPTITFSTTDNVAISYYQVKIDNGSFSTQTSPYQVPVQSAGNHTYTVRAFDTTGNFTDGSVSLTIEISPPAAFTPTVDTPSPSNNRTPILSFSTTDQVGIDHYEVKIDTGAFSIQTSPYQIPALSAAIHTFTVRAFNVNNATTDASLSYTVDLTAPYTFAPTLNVGAYTTDTTPTITFTTNDVSGINRYEVQLDGGSFTAQTSPYTFSALADGLHTFIVRAYDNAGNYRDGTTKTTTVDTTVPNSFTPTANVSSPTGNTRPTISFSTTDNIGINHYEVQVDGGSFTTQTNPYQLPVQSMADHVIVVRAVDNAGNYRDGTLNLTVNGSGPVTFTPTLNVTSPTNNNAPILSFSTTDDGGVDHYQVKVDSGSFTTRTSPYQLPTLSAASHTVTVRAFDTDGNYMDGSVTFVIDLTAPVAFSISVNVGALTNNATPTVTFSTTDAVQMGHYEVKVDSGSYTTHTSPYVLPALDNGAHSVTVRAYDAAGNYRDASAVKTFTVDVTPPASFTPTLNATSPTINTTPTLTFGTSDNLAISYYSVKVDNGSFLTKTSPYQLSPLSNGSHTILVRAYDTAGNYTDGTVTLVVSRTSPDPFTPTLSPVSPTNNPTPTVSFSTIDSSGMDHYEVKIDNGSFTTQTSPYQLPTMSETGLYQTPHTITVRAFNIYGATTDGTVTLRVDTTAPIIRTSIPTKYGHQDITSTTFSVSDNLGMSLANVSASGAVINCSQTYVLAINCTATISQSGTVSFSVTDDAGNQSSVVIPGYIIEQTAPIISITAPTKTSSVTITDTTIRVTDETYLLADNVQAVSGGSIACTQTTTTQVDCTSSISDSGDLVINAYDAAGNPASLTEAGYMISATPPDPFTPTLNVPSQTNNTAPILFFSTTDVDGIDHYEVKVDGGSFSTQVSPYQLPTMAEGFVTITVRAFDTLGNFRDGTVSVNIVTSVPADFTPSLNVSSPTNNTTPEVSFVTTDPVGIDHYELKIDNGDFAAQTSPYVTPILSQGSHVITVRAINTVGNYKDGSVNLIVDLTPPAPFNPIIDSDGSVISSTSPELTYSTTDNVAVSHYEVQIDSGEPSIQASPYVVPTIPEGDHVMTVTAYDTAGNSRVESASAYVDLSSPSIEFNAPTKKSHQAITNTTIQISDNALDVSGVTATGGTINCTQTSSSQVNCTALVSQTGTLTIHAVDLAGNSSSVDITGYIIDNTAPVITITAPTKTSSHTITDTTVSVTDETAINAADVTAVGGIMICSQSSATIVNCSVSVSESGSLIVSAADVSGNTANKTEAGYVINQVGSVPAAFTPTLDTGAYTNITTPTVSFVTTSSDGINRYEVSVDNGSFSVQTSPYKLPELSEGFHTVLVRAYSNGGNFRDGVANVTIDLTKPTDIRIFLDVTSPTNNPRPIITFGASDEVGIGHYEVKVASDGGTFTTQTSPYQVPTLDEEEHTITVRAFDKAGNYIEAEATLLEDRTAPTGGFSINDGAVRTDDRQVTLKLSATDTAAGVKEMIVSEKSDFGGAAFETYRTQKFLVLSDGTANKTIYVKFRDAAGNDSQVYSQSIAYIPAGSNDVLLTGGIIVPETLVNTITQDGPTALFATAAVTVVASVVAYPRVLLYGVFIFRFRKKKQTWGIIYDRKTKNAIPFATIRLYKGKELITQQVSDLDGKYGLLLSKGEYRLEVTHSEYAKFVSEIKFTEAEGAFAEDIALSKNRGDRLSNFRKIINVLNKLFVYLGFAFSLIVFVLQPSVLNLVIILLYVVQAIILWRLMFKKQKEWGYVFNSQNGKKIKGAFVRVYDVTQNKQIDVAITDELGRYTFKLKDGEYLLSAYAPGYNFPAVGQTHIFKSRAGEAFITVYVSGGKPVNQLISLDPIA